MSLSGLEKFMTYDYERNRLELNDINENNAGEYDIYITLVDDHGGISSYLLLINIDLYRPQFF